MNADNEDVEQLLGRLPARGVRPEIRAQVLGAVDARLQPEPASPWLRRSALAVAALLLLGVGMNLWVSARSTRQMAQLFGPASGAWLAQDHRAGQPGEADALAQHYLLLRQLTSELEALSKGTSYEPMEKSPQMDRGRPARAGGDRSGCQRLFRVDHRYTA
jgi:hypothetical protein